jgi:hypothetical protein
MVSSFLGIADEPKAPKPPARTGLGLFRFAGAGQTPH